MILAGARTFTYLRVFVTRFDASDPSFIDPSLDCRSISFENPTGARGAGGAAAGGRKGAPMRIVAPGETVTLAAVTGPGTIRHIWMTVGPAPPEVLRAYVIEFFYDGSDEPSVSVPLFDFFGCPHGRPVAYDSVFHAVQEGRGLNSYLPMPFHDRVTVTFRNASGEPVSLYFQIDYTLEPSLPDSSGYLHATFRRENPTTMKQDFVIVAGLHGPGRFLGCVVGVRVIDEGMWYGEGEVKIYRDGDGTLPTICGTGLEDYVGSAWGLGAHAARYAGAPLVIGAPTDGDGQLAIGGAGRAEFVGFYRWHLLDPVMYADDLTVTIQQIGSQIFVAGEDAEFAAFAERFPVAGDGWMENLSPSLRAVGLHERVDDYCATAFVYCSEVQPVPRVDVAAAVADVGRRAYEAAHPMEAFRDLLAPGGA
jgi:hypothetical protein